MPELVTTLPNFTDPGQDYATYKANIDQCFYELDRAFGFASNAGLWLLSNAAAIKLATTSHLTLTSAGLAVDAGSNAGQVITYASNAKFPAGDISDCTGAPALSAENMTNFPISALSILKEQDYDVSSGSSTAFELTGISGAKIVIITFHHTSFSGIADYNGTFNNETSGYEGNANNFCTGSKVALSSSFIFHTDPVAAGTNSGKFTFIKSASGNVWIGKGSLSSAAVNNQTIMSGSISLAAELSSIKVSTVGGTDTGDAGKITITVLG